MKFAPGTARRALVDEIRNSRVSNLLRFARRALIAARSVSERQRGKIFIIGAVVLALSLPVVAVTGSGVAVLSSLLALAMLAAVTAWQARTSRVASQALGKRLATLERAHVDTTVTLYRRLSAAADGETARLGHRFRQTTALALLACGDVLEAYAVLGEGGALSHLDAAALRQLRNELRRRGYLEKAETVAKVCVRKIGTSADRLALSRLSSEIAVLSGRFTPRSPRVEEGWTPAPGRILHVVGSCLPTAQTGYTLRTHYTVLAQRAAGMDVAVATQAGFGRGDRRAYEELDGVVYHRLPGLSRNSQPIDAWLQNNVTQLARLVASVRPSVLHAASDFLNALSALAVGRAYGIPVVYESRGFWEETWLSRQAETFHWDLARLEAEHGLPDVYLWRREIEDRCRRQADQVVTLADVMADRIAAGGVPRERIAVVPNGVDAAAFPLLARNQKLAEQWGIAADETVIGYVSSIVEYEGIDTLISAYATVKEVSPVPVRLLVVGDGPQRQQLMAQASALGLDDAVFTGKIPHDAVLDYYSLIDIFVVPRKPVEVCQLVTPLKPFEAFSTGRTVVLSDVRALAKIAERSGAAQLFEAGAPQSLADVLGKLLSDPQRRAELSQAGARWVRAERTWAANATVYGRLYARLLDEAAANMPIERLTAVRDVDVLRRDLAEREPIPFEVLAPGDGKPGADRIMDEGWSPALAAEWAKLEPPIDWTGLWSQNRQWSFRLHSWDFMGPVLHTYANTGDRRYLDWCVGRAVDWAQRFNEDDSTDGMAWYDMAIGYRCHRLAYLVEQALLAGTDAAQVEILLTCVVRHQQWIHSDQVFNPRNNHGVYLAVGQLALARRLRAMPGMGTLRAQGLRRLNQMFDRQFGADGAHLEHSPGYHHMVIETLGSAVDAGLIDGEGLRARLQQAQDVLGWFIAPNGELAQVGDTQARQMRFCSSTSPTTDFHMSGGWRGVPDQRQLMVLPQAGYAIVRAPAPQGTEDHLDACHLLFSAGFHSRAHKHADDLSFTWFDHGREILIDSGRFGYVDLLPPDSPLREQGFFYGAPQRQYVESTRAHNTVQADGADHLRRGRRPYGSALLDCAELDGYFKLCAQADHGAWNHRREIICRPGQWLAVFDTVRGLDYLPHDFRAWWQFPADLALRADGDRLVGTCGATEADRLWVTEFSGAKLVGPVCGQNEPLQGWRSKFDTEFEPAWSAAFETTAVPDHTFVTLFSFGEQPLDAVPEHPFRGASEKSTAARHRHLAQAGGPAADASQAQGEHLGQPTRSPRPLAGVTDVPLAKQAYWLDCELRPGQTYRLRTVMRGGRGTQEKAALACFDMDGEPGGTGLAVSGPVGAYTYLRTGEGLLRTDKTFSVAHPVHRIGLRSWGNRGQGELKTFSIEQVPPPQSPAEFFFSFDVEAWSQRAAARPIDTLVWGRLDGGEYGIGRICHVLEQYGIKGNFLIDFATCTLEGEAATRAIIDVLLERGHEVHLHLHPEYLIPTWGVRIPAGRSVQMGRLPFDVSRQLLDFAISRYETFVGSPPKVFRSGSYSMNPDLVLAAGVLGIEALTNVRGDRVADPSLGGDIAGYHEPFVWENGVTEIPVDVSSPEIGAWQNYLRKFDTAMSCKPAERTFNVVMHSWSLLRRNADGVHDAYEPEYERRLHQMCRHAQTCGRTYGYQDYLNQRRWARPVVDISRIRSDQPREVVYLRSEEQVACTVCGCVLSSASCADCPGCDSSVFHRQLKQALGEFGNVFCGRATLAYGMGADGRRERLLGAPSADVGWWPGLGEAPVQLKPRFPDQSQDCFVLLDDQTPVTNAGLALREIERVLRPGGVLVLGQAHPLTACEPWARIADDGFDVCALPALDPVSDTCGRVVLAYKRPARDELT